MQLAFNPDEHVFGFFGNQRLRGHDVLYLAGANAMRQCAQCAVRAGVAVAANNGHAGQGGAVFGADHMHDALFVAQKRKVSGRSKFLDIGVQRGDLLFAGGVGNAVVALLPARGGAVVIGRGDHRADAPQLAARRAQPLKCLRAGHFVHEVTVDVEDGGAVFFGVDDVLIPEFVVECASHCACFLE